MFKKFREKKKALVSPVTGTCIPITECKDPVFKDKMVGDGVALIPEERTIYAPCSGTIVQVAHTYHAICFRSADGMELILHIGIDTVTLEGEGFTCFVETGQQVEAGDKLLEIDLELIKSKGLSLESPCVIANMEQMKSLEIFTGDVVHGESKIMEYSI